MVPSAATTFVKKVTKAKLYLNHSQKMQVQDRLSTSLVTSLALLLVMAFMVQVSECATDCPRPGNRIFNCADYFATYNVSVEQVNKVQDGVEAQLAYINRANEQVKLLFNPVDRVKNATLKSAIRSVIELNELKETIEKVGGLGQDTNSVVTMRIIEKTVEDACKWLKSEGLPVGNCTREETHLLQQIGDRLDFIDTLYEVKEKLRTTTACTLHHYIDYCSWLNHRVLNGCQDPSTYDTELYSSLNGFCMDIANSGSGPRGGCSANLCPMS